MHRDDLTAALSRAEAEAKRADRAEAELAKLRADDKNVDKETDKTEPEPISKKTLVYYCTLFNLIITIFGELMAFLIFGNRVIFPSSLMLPYFFVVGYGLAIFHNWTAGPKKYWPTSYMLIYAISYAVIFIMIKLTAVLLFG